MHGNVGRIIKGIALGGLAIDLLSILIGGVLFAAMLATNEPILIGHVLAGVAMICFGLGTVVLYGFGELVQNSAIIARKTMQN